VIKTGDRVRLKEDRKVFLMARNEANLTLVLKASHEVGEVRSQAVHDGGTPSVWHREVGGEYVVRFITVVGFEFIVDVVCVGDDLEVVEE